MIQEFLDSWALFHNTWLAGWLIAAGLSLLGVLTVARDQIFIGAAVTQASMLGIAFAMWIGTLIGEAAHPWIDSDAFLSATAVVFSILATLVTSRPSGQPGKESPEAVTGWVFLVSASGSILLVAHSPHGTEEIHRLAASSIIGATAGDVWIFLGLLAVTAAALTLFHRPILLMTTDPATAVAIGVRTRLWSLLVSGWLGLAIGLSIRVSGLIFTFGCLVLPALAAKNLSREIRIMFWLSPMLALGVTGFAFVVAHHWDLPPAQMAVVSLGGALVIAWAARAARRLMQRS
ncbi:MAG: metal ABC transporter permease [Planctomycetes bacterium]|nr:metal ABC transporter permease [Planctomycetota bacterium]